MLAKKNAKNMVCARLVPDTSIQSVNIPDYPYFINGPVGPFFLRFWQQYGSKALQGFAACAWEGFASPPRLLPAFDTPPFRAGCGLIGLKAEVSNHKGTSG